ncbi:MAG: hypothetical protein QG602_2608 [Verrucomicrobiota bacterium]|nr:hypothetical protein [Verrucomicrobiota bacterium]
MRTRICFYILLLLPLLVYWQTLSHEFGIREDYQYLRIAREEPGELVKLTASHGRPLYGALLETSYALAGQVENLMWMRLLSVGLLTVLALVLWRQLYHSNWGEVESAAMGLAVVLLPSAQFGVGAAACWPQVLTLLLAMAGFSAVETEIERGGLKRVVALLGGCMIYTAASLIYQSNVLFALLPITAIFLVRSGREPLSDLKWGGTHLAVMLTGMFLGWLLVQGLFSNGVFEQSGRMALETNPFTKLLWFVLHPLPNALALFALADDNFHGVAYYAVIALAVIAVLVFAFRRIKAGGDPVALRKWKICLFALPFIAQGISLMAAERVIGYRTQFALVGLTVVLLFFAIRTLMEGRKIKAKFVYAGYVLVLGLGGLAAERQAYLLIAESQGHEWSLMKGSVLRAGFNKAVKAYVITPSAEHRTTDRIYGDEFGSLTAMSELGAQEMFKAAVRARFPDKLPRGSSYTVESGAAEPADNAYDLVVDMRKLEELRK